MPNDYYGAEDLPERFGRATAEGMARRFKEIEAGFDLLPAEGRLKRGLVGTGEDTSADPNRIVVVTGDVAFGTWAAYERAQAVGWVATAANTGAVEISVDGGPVVPLVDSGLQPLVADHLQPGVFVNARFNGTAFTILAATATIRTGAAGAVFTREQIEAIVRAALAGGGGAGALVVSDVEEVSSAAELAAVSVLRRWACVVVAAPFTSGGVDYLPHDVLVWDNAREPGAWTRIYTEPPASVLPGEAEPLGALVSPRAAARLALLAHETASGVLHAGAWAPRVAPGMVLSVSGAELVQQAFGTFAPAVAPGLAFEHT